MNCTKKEKNLYESGTCRKLSLYDNKCTVDGKCCINNKKLIKNNSL